MTTILPPTADKSSPIKFTLPEFLKSICDHARYIAWLNGKAKAHTDRDRKRFGSESCTRAKYKEMIHAAVCTGGDRDYYTGLPLDWTLISTFDNRDSKYEVSA